MTIELQRDPRARLSFTPRIDVDAIPVTYGDARDLGRLLWGLCDRWEDEPFTYCVCVILEIMHLLEDYCENEAHRVGEWRHLSNALASGPAYAIPRALARLIACNVPFGREDEWANALEQYWSMHPPRVGASAAVILFSPDTETPLA
jgi:hypothetical protein